MLITRGGIEGSNSSIIIVSTRVHSSGNIGIGTDESWCGGVMIGPVKALSQLKFIAW